MPTFFRERADRRDVGENCAVEGVSSREAMENQQRNCRECMRDSCIRVRVNYSFCSERLTCISCDFPLRVLACLLLFSKCVLMQINYEEFVKMMMVREFFKMILIYSF